LHGDAALVAQGRKGFEIGGVPVVAHLDVAVREEDRIEGKTLEATEMHFRDGEPMPCDADEADESFVTCLHGGVERSAFPQSELPFDHVDQVVQLEQIDAIDAETIERSANLLARPRVVALFGLRGEEEPVAMASQ